MKASLACAFAIVVMPTVLLGIQQVQRRLAAAPCFVFYAGARALRFDHC